MLAQFGNHFLPTMAHFDMPIKPKLAETAFLFHRVIDGPFLPKMTNGPINVNCTRYGYVNEI